MAKKVAAMEELAERLPAADRTTWGLLGLGLRIDAQLVLKNPSRAGQMAAELLETVVASKSQFEGKERARALLRQLR